jgi:hypothetical protein
LRHDHAYWISGLRARDLGGNPARAEIDARSLAFGEGDPGTRSFRTLHSGPPAPATVEGTDWTGIPRVTPHNALTVTLDNIASATVDGLRARLDGGQSLRVRIVSDGEGQLGLNLPLPAGVTATRIEGPPLPRAAARASSAPEVRLSRQGASFEVAAGTREYLIGPAGAGNASAGGGGGEGGGEGGGAVAALMGARASGGLAGAVQSTHLAGEGGGPLPFTGLPLAGLFLLGAGLVGSGLVLRRR